VIDQFERKFFKRALERNNGNVSRTAEALTMHRKNLQEKLERLGLNPKEFAESD
jgi:two-component system response regulator AtoC/two-component system nitrogen regulation response regulator NtrX